LAYLSSREPVSNDTVTDVPFDSTIRGDFSGFNTSTGEYTVQHAGDYHVDFCIDWVGTGYSTGDQLKYFLKRNGSTIGGLRVSAYASGGPPSHSYSKTLFGLEVGDTIQPQVVQKTGEEQTLEDDSDATYLCIRKVG